MPGCVLSFPCFTSVWFFSVPLAESLVGNLATGSTGPPSSKLRTCRMPFPGMWSRDGFWWSCLGSHARPSAQGDRVSNRKEGVTTSHGYADWQSKSSAILCKFKKRPKRKMVANNKHTDTDFLNAWYSLQIKCVIWELCFYWLPVCVILEACGCFSSVLRDFCKELPLG